MFNKSEQALLDFIDKADTNQGQFQFIDAISVVNSNRQVVEQRFREEIARGFSEYLNEKPISYALPLLERLGRYLSRGVTESGACRFDCQHETPEVVYYGAALAAALSRATSMELGDYSELAARAFQRVLSLQRNDGNMQYYSTRNYGWLSDRRSYPRYLSMILYHLLLEIQKSVRTKDTVSHCAMPV